MKKLLAKYGWVILKNTGADIKCDLKAKEGGHYSLIIDDGEVGVGNGLNNLWHIYIMYDLNIGTDLAKSAKIFEGIVHSKDEFLALMSMLEFKEIKNKS